MIVTPNSCTEGKVRKMKFIGRTFDQFFNEVAPRSLFIKFEFLILTPDYNKSKTEPLEIMAQDFVSRSRGKETS